MCPPSAPPHWTLILWPHRSLSPQGFAVFIAITFAMLLVPLLSVMGTKILWGLLPADGFYEWRKEPGARFRQPFRIQMKDGGLFAFAGIWEPAGGGPEPLPTCATRTLPWKRTTRPPIPSGKPGKFSTSVVSMSCPPGTRSLPAARPGNMSGLRLARAA